MPPAIAMPASAARTAWREILVCTSPASGH